MLSRSEHFSITRGRGKVKFCPGVPPLALFFVGQSGLVLDPPLAVYSVGICHFSIDWR